MGASARSSEILSPATSGQPRTQWQRYVVKGEEFSVLFPEMPALSRESVYVSRLKVDREERILGAYEDGVVYAVYCFGNPKLRDSLKNFIDEIATLLPSGKIYFHRELSLGGFRGKQYLFRSDDVRGVIQFYEAERHLYAFEAIGAGEDDHRAKKFFSSLLFEKKPVGQEVRNGSGSHPDPANSVGVGKDPVKPFSSEEVTRRALVVTKPVPAYSGLAQRNQVSGTVVLTAVFSSSGRVTNIAEVVRLKDGLTEKAVEAARQIRFVPAVKDGRFVSTRIELQYNFF
jgi:TonB family protein